MMSLKMTIFPVTYLQIVKTLVLEDYKEQDWFLSKVLTYFKLNLNSIFMFPNAQLVI